MSFVQWGTEEKNWEYVIRREEEVSSAVSERSGFCVSKRSCRPGCVVLVSRVISVSGALRPLHSSSSLSSTLSTKARPLGTHGSFITLDSPPSGDLSQGKLVQGETFSADMNLYKMLKSLQRRKDRNVLKLEKNKELLLEVGMILKVQFVSRAPVEMQKTKWWNCRALVSFFSTMLHFSFTVTRCNNFCNLFPSFFSCWNISQKQSEVAPRRVDSDSQLSVQLPLWWTVTDQRLVVRPGLCLVSAELSVQCSAH